MIFCDQCILKITILLSKVRSPTSVLGILIEIGGKGCGRQLPRISLRNRGVLMSLSDKNIISLGLRSVEIPNYINLRFIAAVNDRNQFDQISTNRP